MSGTKPFDAPHTAQIIRAAQDEQRIPLLLSMLAEHFSDHLMGRSGQQAAGAQAMTPADLARQLRDSGCPDATTLLDLIAVFLTETRAVYLASGDGRRH